MCHPFEYLINPLVPYVKIVLSLLNCRSQDEINAILAANRDLLDTTFLETMEAVAELISKQGNENTKY